MPDSKTNSLCVATLLCVTLRFLVCLNTQTTRNTVPHASQPLTSSMFCVRRARLRLDRSTASVFADSLVHEIVPPTGAHSSRFSRILRASLPLLRHNLVPRFVCSLRRCRCSPLLEVEHRPLTTRKELFRFAQFSFLYFNLASDCLTPPSLRSISSQTKHCRSRRLVRLRHSID